jgi:hypothetical protein
MIAWESSKQSGLGGDQTNMAAGVSELKPSPSPPLN